MTITNRIVVFIWGSLGAVLGTYSLVAYWVIHENMMEQFEDEMNRIHSSLVAAIEVEETEVKWQPLEHSIDKFAEDAFGEVHWCVIGDNSVIVDSSERTDPEFNQMLQSHLPNHLLHRTSISDTYPPNWTFKSTTLKAPNPAVEIRESDEFDELRVIVGRDTTLLSQHTTQLIAWLTFIPLSILLVASFSLRYLTRHALAPLFIMAKQIESISLDDFRSRLKAVSSNDEIAQLATAFNLLLSRKEVAFQHIQQFTGDAAHQLKTPLTILLGNIDVILRKDRTPDEYRDTLLRQRNQVVHLNSIVEDLLALVRKGANEKVPFVQLDIRDWIQTQSENWISWPRFKDIQIEFLFSGSPLIETEPKLLGQLVGNLLDNACKYSPDGTPITIQVSRNKTNWELQIRDLGDGIDDGDCERVFEPFYRGERSRLSGVVGTGLGLAIARRIADELNGTLTYGRNANEETIFCLKLPI